MNTFAVFNVSIVQGFEKEAVKLKDRKVHRAAPVNLCVFRVCSSSETESEAGDLLEQQFEELNNNNLPTGYLRMVSRNNRFNRSEFSFLNTSMNSNH